MKIPFTYKKIRKTYTFFKYSKKKRLKSKLKLKETSADLD